MIAQRTHASNSSAECDVLVIGAGPAGSLAAILLARAGKSVLLVDAKDFPRRKVCGGCLNARSLAVLRHIPGISENPWDVSAVLTEAHAVPLHSFRWSCGRNRIVLPMSHSMAVDRAAFDHALVRAAVRTGVRFVPSTTGVVLPTVRSDRREVLLKGREECAVAALDGAAATHPCGVAAAKIVVCADGLSQSSLRRLPGFSCEVAASSRIGLAGTVPDASPDFPAGSLSMTVASDGYCGVARTGNGRLNIAAAVDARRLAVFDSPGGMIRNILRRCGLPLPRRIDETEWTGTPALTRRSRRVADERLFVLGDAAGYVEPFTGEGMSFAMLSAVLLAPLALRAADSWHDAFRVGWERQLKKKVFAKQWTCRFLSRLLRSPALCGLAIAACRTLPVIPRRIMAKLNAVDDLQ